MSETTESFWVKELGEAREQLAHLRQDNAQLKLELVELNDLLEMRRDFADEQQRRAVKAESDLAKAHADAAVMRCACQNYLVTIEGENVCACCGNSLKDGRKHECFCPVGVCFSTNA